MSARSERLTRLTPDALAGLGNGVAVPAYDREEVGVGIVHFGVGGFHRAHQAMYLDRLLADGAARDWGICGVGTMPGDKAMADVLQAQGGLYTLVVKGPDGSMEARVIGSMVDYLFAPEDPEAVLAVLTAPTTRIVSLTVTEGGYHFHPSTGEFDPDDPVLQADLAPGATPQSVFGFITEALARRKASGTPAFTVMSCDNIQGNGEVAHKMVTAFARLKDPALAGWIEAEVAFPSSMVDRITPVTTDDDRARVAQEFGIDDGWPVLTEPFTQWVLEDHFPQGRPPYERAGVQVVEDVTPYELMKLRLLNASHQALCYLGHLAGYRYAHEVCQDELFTDFLLGYMAHEGQPTLSPVPGVDLDRYEHQLIERFANPEIRDTLARLCAESSDRIPKWLVPVIREQLAAGGPVERSALVVASWARYAEGVDEQGEPIAVVDRFRDRLMERAQRQHEEPLAFLQDRSLFGDLVDEPRFVEVYTRALDSLHSVGARATLQAWQQ